jgi:hypothetical protein
MLTSFSIDQDGVQVWDLTVRLFKTRATHKPFMVDFASAHPFLNHLLGVIGEMKLVYVRSQLSHYPFLTNHYYAHVDSGPPSTASHCAAFRCCPAQVTTGRP